jgi:hypothetical protein
VSLGVLAANIRVELRQRLRADPCRPMGSNEGGVETVGTRIRYPEATVKRCILVEQTGIAVALHARQDDEP